MEESIYSNIVQTLEQYPGIGEHALVDKVSSATRYPLPKVHEQFGRMVLIGILKRHGETILLTAKERR
jgi:hypothetical protein